MILAILQFDYPNINCKAELVCDLFFASCSDDLLRLWKVFSDDKDRPNRYLLAKEFETRPDAEELEVISFNSKLHFFGEKKKNGKKNIFREKERSKFVGEKP